MALLAFKGFLYLPPVWKVPVLKIPRRVNFGMGRKFRTDAAKRYGEGSEMLLFLGKRGRKRCKQKVKDYGGSKINYGFERRSIFSREGSFGWCS